MVDGIYKTLIFIQCPCLITPLRGFLNRHCGEPGCCFQTLYWFGGCEYADDLREIQSRPRVMKGLRSHAVSRGTFWIAMLNCGNQKWPAGSDPCTNRPIVFSLQIGKRKWNNNSLSDFFYISIEKRKRNNDLLSDFSIFFIFFRFPIVVCSMEKRKWNNETLSVFHPLFNSTLTQICVLKGVHERHSFYNIFNVKC